MEFKIIQNTPLYSAFSDLGKRIFLPEGIFYWSGRAKKEAELMGTIGAAFAFENNFIDGGSSEWVPCYLEDIKEKINFPINKLVPYAQISGINELRELWNKWIVEKSLYDEVREVEKLKRLENYISMPIITSGLTNGIFLSSALFLNPGEFIVSPNKRWGNYDNIVERYLGAKIRSFQFFTNGSINIKGLKETIQDVSKLQNKIVIILNFPNNPTGYVPTTEEGEELVDTLRDAQRTLEMPIITIVDDAYEPFKFSDNVIKRSIFYDLQQLDENLMPVKLDGISKEFLLYGARIGFLTIGLKSSWIKDDEELRILKYELDNKLSGMIRSTISNCNQFYQNLTVSLFKDVGTSKIIQRRKQIIELLKSRFIKINSELSKITCEDVSVDPNSGGFFVFVNLNPEKIMANKFADFLLREYKVGVIPIEKPEENINGIRIAYCSIDLKKIPDFAHRIKMALDTYS